MTEKIKDLVLKAVSEAQAKRSESPTDWDGSTYEALYGLSIDERGHIGEQLCAGILQRAGHVVEWDPNVTLSEQDYDLMCDGLRIEVKLACRGRNANTFQHEHLDRTRHFDGMVLIDIAPNAVYAVCQAKEDLPWDDMHRRKDSIVYKYDLSVKKHEDAGNRVETVSDFVAKFQQMKKRIEG